MKKVILALVAVLMAGVSANAFIDNQYMTTPQYLRNTGFSSEMARMMAITNQDPYREPYVEKKTFKDLLKRSYNYLVPGAYTDLDFYGHDGSFNNPSWKDL